MTAVELTTTSMAVGGEAVAREETGRVVFVGGALGGERVTADVFDERSTFARATTLSVIEPSPDRVEPPCPHVAEGCGGCDWQHVAPGVQRELRRSLVEDVLDRAKGIVAAGVGLGPEIPAEHVRTTVRGIAGPDGRFAFRRRRSHEPVQVGSCLISHPAVEEIVRDGRFGTAREVTVRAGARTGERLVLVDPCADGVHVPDDVTVVSTGQLAQGHRAWIHEQAAGRRWRISAGSFFQASAEGAEALVQAVGSYVEQLPGAERMVDLCCGVGLFAGTVGAQMSVLGVERSASAVADARHNLADVEARIVKVALARWRPTRADVVVADPARAGLGRDGVRAVAGTGAELCVLVSCDPAALGRDASLMAAEGFEHVGSTVLDLFGHTSHIEVVSGFRRASPTGRSGR
jgi:23S rRNA (uracil1939-C5)-methyltransferase